MILFNIWDIFFEGLILDVKKKNIKIDIKKYRLIYLLNYLLLNFALDEARRE